MTGESGAQGESSRAIDGTVGVVHNVIARPYRTLSPLSITPRSTNWLSC